jgi:hypothetical protein
MKLGVPMEEAETTWDVTGAYARIERQFEEKEQHWQQRLAETQGRLERAGEAEVRHAHRTRHVFSNAYALVPLLDVPVNRLAIVRARLRRRWRKVVVAASLWSFAANGAHPLSAAPNLLDVAHSQRWTIWCLTRMCGLPLVGRRRWCGGTRTRSRRYLSGSSRTAREVRPRLMPSATSGEHPRPRPNPSPCAAETFYHVQCSL